MRHHAKRVSPWFPYGSILLGTLVLVLALLSGPARSRIQPYYILSRPNALIQKNQPRFIVLLDKSNSMMASAQPLQPDGTLEFRCPWGECEVPGARGQSRMTAAREGIRQMIREFDADADFALMTFEATDPPATVPTRCWNWFSKLVDPSRRFKWVRHASMPKANKPPVWGTGSWLSIRPVTAYPGYLGHWVLCGEHDSSYGANGLRFKGYPYPYLRWDDLGVGPSVTANNQTGPLPPSPMISVAQADMMADQNARRKVQWFPRFMGPRINLNVTTDPALAVLNQTIGDYGTPGDTTTLIANVWNQDFYYWPYVDGFPGYSRYDGLVDYWVRPNGFEEIRQDEVFSMGVVTGTLETEARLYTPFYLGDMKVNLGAVPAAQRGPAARADNLRDMGWAVSPLMEGGIEPASHQVDFTPLAEMVGVVPASAPVNNNEGAHPNVASYVRFLRGIDTDTAICNPTSMILVTDGEPGTGWSNGTYPALYQNLAALRRQLGVKIFVVGAFPHFSGNDPILNAMACAGAGACQGCSDVWSPCNDVPANNWDTCNDVSAPHSKCAFTAKSPEELADALRRIVQRELDLDLGSGSVGVYNDVRGDDVVQTSVRAYTNWPGWRGHVERTPCSDPDPADANQLAPWCDGATDFTPDELAEPRLGPCPYSRSWDAGECLRQMGWQGRRLFSNTATNARYWIYANGAATGAFRAELVGLGLIANDSEAQQNATSIAEFILGKDWPQGWVLPGVANSTPVVARRIPAYRASASPTVAIRDPHCAGRLPGPAGVSLPTSLEQFAKEAWDPTLKVPNPAPHHSYMEATFVGDDLGVIHAFRWNTGNEMWGYIPRFMLANAVEQWRNGPVNRGQPGKVADHRYGVASTGVQGWVYDSGAATWRHLLVFGFGKGAPEYVALDVSDMSPWAATTPENKRYFRVLWTSEDAGHKATYDDLLGETWARPALTYEVPNDDPSQEPKAFLVMASGYRYAGAHSDQGRTVMLVDAVTGALVESADVHTPGGSERYDAVNFGLSVDPVVATHCKSRVWAEMQEVYLADPAGRLMRWDLGHRGTPRHHEADLGGPWNGERKAAKVFFACTGSGNGCIPRLNVGTRIREPFVYAPAVTALDRIDTSGTAAPVEDQFLIALNSGSANEDTIPWDDPANRFHSSLLLLVDNHTSWKAGGFVIPPEQQILSGAGIDDYPQYFRIQIGWLWKRRTFQPFPGAPWYTEAASTFDGKRARPIRAPRISVTAVAEDDGAGNVTLADDLEVYTVTYTYWEPGSTVCDPRWYDAATDTWYADEGAIYEIKLRLTADSATGFNFTTGGTGPTLPFGGNLTYLGAKQVLRGDCADGVCAPTDQAPYKPSCSSVVGSDPPVPIETRLPMAQHSIAGFSPNEG